jgi:hypothetical protein
MFSLIDPASLCSMQYDIRATNSFEAKLRWISMFELKHLFYGLKHLGVKLPVGGHDAPVPFKPATR